MGQYSTTHMVIQALALLPYLAALVVGVVLVRRYLLK
jgi:hypothetical protein